MVICRSILRSDIWLVDFEPGITGHEQGGKPRPAVIISSSAMNSDDTGLVIVVPSTTTKRIDPVTGELVPNHYQMEPNKENGLSRISYFMCEQVRCVSVDRLSERRLGRLSAQNMYEIEERLIILMDLGA